MQPKELTGRKIDSAPYTGVVDSFCKISMMCIAVNEASEELTKHELVEIISRILHISQQGLSCTSVNISEIEQISQHLLEYIPVIKVSN